MHYVLHALRERMGAVGKLCIATEALEWISAIWGIVPIAHKHMGFTVRATNTRSHLTLQPLSPIFHYHDLILYHPVHEGSVYLPYPPICCVRRRPILPGDL